MLKVMEKILFVILAIPIGLPLCLLGYILLKIPYINIFMIKPVRFMSKIINNIAKIGE